MSDIAQAYAEMDYILKYVPADMNVKVPQRIKNLISTRKDPNYVVRIDNRVPLHQQNLLKTTKSLIALLYYNYWCVDQQEKDELKMKFIENDKLARQMRNNDNNNTPTGGMGGTSNFGGSNNGFSGTNSSAQFIVESEPKQVVLQTAEEKRIGFNIQESAIDSVKNQPTIDEPTKVVDQPMALTEIKKPGFFKKLKGFFARLFGAKSESYDQN